MYTGAMEPFWLIGVYPLGWGAGWAVTGKLGVEKPFTHRG